MTDTARSPRPRSSRRALRAWAWVAGVAAFASPAAALVHQPKPSTLASGRPAGRPVIVVRKITRRVIVRRPARPGGVRYVVVGGGGSASSGGTTGGSTVAAPQPAPAPATTTGGS